MFMAKLLPLLLLGPTRMLHPKRSNLKLSWRYGMISSTKVKGNTFMNTWRLDVYFPLLWQDIPVTICSPNSHCIGQSSCPLVPRILQNQTCLTQAHYAFWTQLSMLRIARVRDHLILTQWEDGIESTWISHLYSTWKERTTGVMIFLQTIPQVHDVGWHFHSASYVWWIMLDS